MSLLITYEIFCFKNFSLFAEIFLSCSILQLTFYAISTTYNRKFNFIIVNSSFYYVTTLIIILTSFLLLNEDSLINNSYISNNSIINDYLSFITKIVVCVFSIVFLIVINVLITKDEPIKNHFEFVVLIMISILGLLILSSSNDLIISYLAIELQSIAFYIMAAFKKKSAYSIESSLKYFIIGSLASAFFLFGSSLIYGFLGCLNFDDFRMFSSISFQKNIVFPKNTHFDYIKVFFKTCFNLTLAKLMLVEVLTIEDMSLCPKQTSVVPIKIIEKLAIDVISHPISNIFSNLTLHLRPFFILKESENFPSLLIDYYVNTFYDSENIYSDILHDPKNQQTSDLNCKKISEEKLLEIFFFRKNNSDEIINPLSFWFTLFEYSYFLVNYETHLFYDQFDITVPRFFVYDKSSFLNYYEFLLDLNFIESSLLFSFDNNISIENKINFDVIEHSPIVLFNQICFLYDQMQSSDIFLNLKFFKTAINDSLLSLGFLFICVSIFIKLAIAPFHYWSLDVYEGSPNKTTAFFAIIPKIALFVLLTRFCYNSFYYIFIENYQIFFIILSVASIFIGSFGGIEQRKIKTLFAYSSLNHSGYILLSFSTGSLEGTHLMFYYILLYMLSGMCFWSIYLFLIKKSLKFLNKNNKELGDFALLKKSNPMLALVLSMTLFSIAGIPPVVGFLAKVGIFLVVIKSSVYFIAFISIVFSVISTFYYIRFIKILYFDNFNVGKLYIPILTKKSLFIAFIFILLFLWCFDPVILYLIVYKTILLLNC